jgi:hypothetical protein
MAGKYFLSNSVNLTALGFSLPTGRQCCQLKDYEGNLKLLIIVLFGTI